MKDTLYIIFNNRSIIKGVKTTPALGVGEYLFALNIEVPDSVFKAPPVPVIAIKLDGPQIQPAAVTVNGEAQALPANADKATRVQAEMLKQLANMVAAGRHSTDEAVRAVVDNVIDDLLLAGVDVRIESAEVPK